MTLGFFLSLSSSRIKFCQIAYCVCVYAQYLLSVVHAFMCTKFIRKHESSRFFAQQINVDVCLPLCVLCSSVCMCVLCDYLIGWKASCFLSKIKTKRRYGSHALNYWHSSRFKLGYLCVTEKFVSVMFMSWDACEFRKRHRESVLITGNK